MLVEERELQMMACLPCFELRLSLNFSTGNGLRGCNNIKGSDLSKTWYYARGGAQNTRFSASECFVASSEKSLLHVQANKTFKLLVYSIDHTHKSTSSNRGTVSNAAKSNSPEFEQPSSPNLLFAAQFTRIFISTPLECQDNN